MQKSYQSPASNECGSTELSGKIPATRTGEHDEWKNRNVGVRDHVFGGCGVRRRPDRAPGPTDARRAGRTDPEPILLELSRFENDSSASTGQKWLDQGN